MRQSIPPWMTGNPRAQFQLALVLVALVGAILVGKYWEEAQIAAMRRDSRSMFDDRLVPEALLFHSIDVLHQRRSTLQRFLARDAAADSDELSYTLGQHSGRLNEILAQFGRTYLVEDEARHLTALRTALDQYTASESRLIARWRAGEEVAYEDVLQDDFDAVRGELLRLSAVQQTVGAQLEASSESSASRVTMLLYFQLGAAFVLGLVASALAMSMGRPPATRPTDGSGHEPQGPPQEPRRGRRPELRAVTREDARPESPGPTSDSR